MQLKRWITGLVFCFNLSISQAQDSLQQSQSKKIEIQLEGMIAFSLGNDFYSMNVGGPALFLQLNKKIKIGIAAMPSLYILEGKLGARLGVSPRIDVKNWVFIAPFFHREQNNQWISSFGIGYKFHSKK